MLNLSGEYLAELNMIIENQESILEILNGFTTSLQNGFDAIVSFLVFFVLVILLVYSYKLLDIFF